MTAQRMVRPATAFAATSGRQKRNKIDSRQHEAFIRELPCVICGDATSTECAHVSYADLRYGKFGRGKGQKEESIWVVPLCGEHHRQQHDAGGERHFWGLYRIDPCRIAACLFIRTQDHEAAQLILDRAMD